MTFSNAPPRDRKFPPPTTTFPHAQTVSARRPNALFRFLIAMQLGVARIVSNA